MGNIMEYKGYHTKVEFDADSLSLRGVIEGINDYVEFCAEVGKEPEREYKGTFNIRISPELHKKIALKAFKEGYSLNAEVEKAIERFVE